MNTVVKLIGFAAGLALVFTGAALAGGALDPSPPRSDGPAEHQPMGEATAMGGASSMGVRGLSVAADGLRIVVDEDAFARGRQAPLRFRIVDERGATVRDFDVEHTKRMHLIVVRRDLTNFQHLHPVQARDGSWSTPLRLDAAGSYRVFADFSHDAKPVTLASDLRVNGTSTLDGLPAPRPVAQSDSGYAVKLAETKVRAGEEAELRFTVTRNGAPVQVQPYLGAMGHLVALREGDLAFLHVHPTKGVTFESTFPTTGRYRLFLQFKHNGRVHTAAFTQVVA